MSWAEDTTRAVHLQAALDACCAALLALECVRDELEEMTPSEPIRAYTADLQAIELVRAAIGEIRRSAGSRTPSLLAMGFVQPHAAV